MKKIIRYLLIGITIAVAVWATVNINFYLYEFKDIFYWSNNWLDLIMIFVLIIAIGAIIRWFVLLEEKVTR